MKLLSIDQSTKATGWAMFDGTDLVAHGVISPKSGEDLWERMQIIRNEIDRLIKENKPKAVVIEGVAMLRDQQALIKLGQLQGLIMASAFSRNIPIDIYMPTHWRKLNGFKQGGGVKRAYLKQQAIDMIENDYGLSPTEDEAEAIAIGVAWLREHGKLPRLDAEKNKEKKGDKKDGKKGKGGKVSGSKSARKAGK